MLCYATSIRFIVLLLLQRDLRMLSTSPFGADKADTRYYGSSRYNGSYPGVIGARNEDLH